MSNKKKNKRKTGSIPQPDADSFPKVHSGKLVDGSTEHAAPAFSFYHLDTSSECPSTWTVEETKALFDLFRKATSMEWHEVRKDPGIDFKPVEAAQCRRSLPPRIAEDVQLSQMRVS